MGLSTSKLKENTIDGNFINEIDGKKIIYKNNVNDKKFEVFYFDDDIANECYKIFGRIKGTDNKVNILHHQSIIYVIHDDIKEHLCHPSRKVSPISFSPGFAL